MKIVHPREVNQVPNNSVTKWDRELVWTVLEKRKSLPAAGIRAPIRHDLDSRSQAYSTVVSKASWKSFT